MSEIRATTISDSAGTGPVTLTGQSAAKAWGAANMTTTVLRTNNFNVSSLTDNGTGQARFNLTNAMSDADYVCVSSTAGYDYASIPITASQFESAGVNSSGSYADWSSHHGIAMGDLA